MTKPAISFVVRVLRHVALPALAAGSVALTSHVALAQSIEEGSVGTEYTSAVARTAVSRARGAARVSLNGTHTSSVSAAAGSTNASTRDTLAHADGALASARATDSLSTGTQHATAAVGFVGQASTQDLSGNHHGTASVRFGDGHAHSWAGVGRDGSSARLSGDGDAAAHHGAHEVDASGVGDLRVSASRAGNASSSRASIAGTGTVSAHIAGLRVSASAAGGRASVSGRTHPMAGSRSAGFRLR
jgi:hypothetical protein